VEPNSSTLRFRRARRNGLSIAPLLRFGQRLAQSVAGLVGADLLGIEADGRRARRVEQQVKLANLLARQARRRLRAR
jgi:hypothetical protein